MIAIVNCHGDWFHTQKRGVNGAFLVLTVLQKENLPEATEAPSPAPSAPPRPFPPAQTLFWPLSHLLHLFLKLHFYLVLYQVYDQDPYWWLFFYFSRTVANIVYLCLHRRVWVYPKKEVMVEWKMFSTEQSLRFPRISRIISIPFILRRLASETRPTICPAAISLSE